MHLGVDVSHFQYSPSDEVLHGVAFGLRRGKTLAVLGGSGCGKSTLLRVIAGLLPAKPEHNLTGCVSIGGTTPEVYRASGRLAFMFQSPTLFPNRTVMENVVLPLELLGRRGSGRADELIEMVGLEGYRDYLPRQLSGGMRTRVALARSFVAEPEVLLLDEPFAALDLSWKQELYGSLADLKGRYDTTVVMVTHDLQEAVYNANQVLVLGRGGSPLETMEIDKALPRAFPFRDTVSEFTGQLDRLAHLLTNDALCRGTSREAPLRLLDEREALLADLPPAAGPASVAVASSQGT